MRIIKGGWYAIVTKGKPTKFIAMTKGGYYDDPIADPKVKFHSSTRIGAIGERGYMLLSDITYAKEIDIILDYLQILDDFRKEDLDKMDNDCHYVLGVVIGAAKAGNLAGAGLDSYVTKLLHA